MDKNISKEILPGIHQVDLSDTTIEQGVSSIHIFIIPGKDGVNDGRSLMIDTGFKNDRCLETLEAALRELHISKDKLDIFLTHRHHDHCGLAGTMSKEGARLFMNPSEERHPYDCLAYRVSEESKAAQKKVLRSCGLTEELTPEVWKTFMDISDRVQHHGEWVLAIWGFPYTEIHDGDIFQYGNYRFTAKALKGHTYGQMGLMEWNKKLFFTADQIIHRISPIVATTYPDETLLQSFFDSLRFIKEQCSDWTIIPSHGEILKDIPGDVDKTVFSYLNKTTNVRDLLKTKNEMTTHEIAEVIYQVTKIPENEAEFFTYKMLITKTYSLLEYLYGLDFINRTERDGIFYWSYKKPD
ncbi:MBL fold metallo-hydrolase [Oribacterium sp. WCC10]|uniref:MBL fold metallo-hydrolase n=1 Tax=Oribacterium sp. WCC10 TaxID=1855343 RepID=UPI0008E15671|nr:MBL fold metallo-hydrolase [Oribacterium sp. WCC10]SFG10012.1 Glyoxylase, beta-lactamase superfamily II [Oribacterium sp. WCC10]